MFIISERINGQFISVGKAIDNRDSKFIQELALKQVDSGAQALDVNVGPGRDNGPEDMTWLVSTVQEVTEVPLCIDAFGPKTMEAGVKACNNPIIMNSTNADPARMEKYFPICREYNADIICLCMDEKGIPNSADARAEMAMLMMATAMDMKSCRTACFWILL